MDFAEFERHVARLASLQHNRHDKRVVVVVDPGYPTVGGTPCVPVTMIYAGIDWDGSKIMLRTETALVPARNPEQWQIRPRPRYLGKGKVDDPAWINVSEARARNPGRDHEARCLYAGPLPKPKDESK